MEREPNNPDLLNELAGMLRVQGNLDESAKVAEKAIQLEPDDPSLYSNLGMTRRLQGRLEDAEVALRRAISLDPTDGRVHLYLGDILVQSGRIESARAEIQAALKLDPGLAARLSPQAADLLGITSSSTTVVKSASDIANENVLSVQEKEQGIRDSSPSQVPERGLSFPSTGAEEWKDHVGVRLRGTITLRSDASIEFENLRTARPTYVSDRRTSPTEFSISRRIGDRRELTSIDLRRVKSLLFSEPEELPGGRYQTSGSYIKIKIAYQDGQSETTHCGRFGKLYYSPPDKGSEEFKVDVMEIREIDFFK